MIKLEINGKTVKADSGAMIIEAADEAGIYIPRFCYHKKLSIAANCRMCLVEVEKSAKPLPACATPITDGMKVFTKSPKALEAQNYVMEYLLINHPLDCPICDQGGECELQDLSMGFGRDASLYLEPKRSVHDDDLGPLIATEMTRCIQCTRCVRFGEEIAGIRELGMTNRGELSEITTYIKHSLTSEISGNIIDLCPVGALTSKPYRFRARAWELIQKSTIAAHDCLGSNIHMHLRNGDLMRVAPKENEALNETWLSDRDRFSYLGLQHEDRIIAPRIKHQGQWQDVDWTKAFEYAVKGLKEIIRSHGAEQVGSLMSPTATLEEAYLLQKILRDLGCNNMDHRVQQTDFTDDSVAPITPIFDTKIAALSEQDCILLIGSNIQREQPLLGQRVRTTTCNEGRVLCVNPMDCDFNFPVAAKAIVHPDLMVTELAAIANALGASKAEIPEKLTQSIKSAAVSESAKQVAQELQFGDKKTIVLGALALNHPQASAIRSLAQVIASLTNAKLATLTAGPNTAGAHLVGVLPHREVGGKVATRTGLNAQAMLQEKLKAYILFNLEPELDCANPALIQEALAEADFVIAFAAYPSKALEAHADIILPIAPFTETHGTFVNAQGDWQSFSALTHAPGQARPGWKVLRVFANLLELDGYQYVQGSDITKELTSNLADMTTSKAQLFDTTLDIKTKADKLTRIAEWPLYRCDSVVRRAKALQDCGANEQLYVRINKATAKQIGVADGDKVKVTQNNQQAQLPLRIDQRIPDHCVYLANAYDETTNLGESFGEIKVEKL